MADPQQKEPSFFDFVNEILTTKKDLLRDGNRETAKEKDYNSFMVVRALSMHHDCSLWANEMNLHNQLSPKMQHDFLINTVRSSRRGFTKWPKPVKDDFVEILQTYCKVGKQKAKEINRILTQDQKEEIKKKMIKGGRDAEKENR